jgi:hypothetical protein
LWFHNKIVRAEFFIETDEVKKEVEDYRQSLFGNIVVDDSADAEKAKRVATVVAHAK